MTCWSAYMYMYRGENVPPAPPPPPPPPSGYASEAVLFHNFFHSPSPFCFIAASAAGPYISLFGTRPTRHCPNARLVRCIYKFHLCFMHKCHWETLKLLFVTLHHKTNNKSHNPVLSGWKDAIWVSMGDFLKIVFDIFWKSNSFSIFWWSLEA